MFATSHPSIVGRLYQAPIGVSQKRPTMFAR